MGTVNDIMTKEAECCSLLDNMYEVAVKMKDPNVGAIAIIDGEYFFVWLPTEILLFVV